MPPEQEDTPNVHVMPQPPQLKLSELVLVQPPEQSVNGDGQPMHVKMDPLVRIKLTLEQLAHTCVQR